MHKQVLLCALVVASWSSAQSPCAPPTHIATNNPFISTHYLGTTQPPSPYPGFSLMYDAVIDGPALVSRIDQNLYDDGVNPLQVGNTTTMDVWVVPTTYVGNELNQAAWLLLATGTLTVAGSGSHSICQFTPPFVFPAGAWGVALQTNGTTLPQPTGNAGPLHPLLLIPCLAAGNPAGCTMNPSLGARDTFMTISNTTIQRYSWQSGIGGNYSINMDIHYSLPAGTAFYSEYGVGCYRLSNSFYEVVRPPAAPDFNNVGISLTPNGATSYNAGPGTATFEPVSSAPLQNSTSTGQLGVNQTSAPLTLPFTFSYPGGGGLQVTTSQIIVAANGYVWLSGVDGGGFRFQDIPTFLAGQARVAGFWAFLDPSPTTGSGAVYFDVGAGNQSVAVTWQGVQMWTGATGGAPLSFQIVLHASGQIDLRYANTQLTTFPALVGFTPGGGDLDPGNFDLVVNGTARSFQTPDGSRPLHLTAGNRPVIGTTFNIQTDTIRAGSTAGLLVFSTQALLPGTSLAPYGLTPIGASVCTQYVSPPLGSLFFLVGGPQVVVPFAIPNAPVLSGAQLMYETALLSSGLNPAGMIASNGLCVQAGIQ